MALDPRTPVLVGAGQVLSRPDESVPLIARPEPVELMARALELAAKDTGAPGGGRKLLERAGTLRILPPLSWKYTNPGLIVAEQLGIEPGELALASIGGNGPQSVAGRTCLEIANGDLDVALIAGADCIGTRRLARRDPDNPPLPWTIQPAGTPEPVGMGTDRDPVTAVERAASLDRPLRVFPLFASALRFAAGRTIDEDATLVSEMWARFSEVASHNPYAWSQEPRTADEIRTVGPGNRMVSFPYPKLQMANDRVDLGAAFILCSLESAVSAGVPADRMIFPVSGAEANDHWFLTHRMDLHSSPAIKTASARTFELAGKSIDDCRRIDLYSCFPCAVQIAADAIGVAVDDPTRSLTITGGLGFAGGPGNNYVTHSIATMSSLLRSEGGTGFLTGLGWFATKHSMGIWSSEPPTDGFHFENVQSEVDAMPQRAPANQDDGMEGTVETYTVLVGRDSRAELGIFAVLTENGERGWGTTTDEDLLHTLMVEEGCGRRAQIRPDGRVDIR
jgi:acetyl-CoA C-acetyltransferase